MRHHEWILSRTRNWSNLAVSYSNWRYPRRRNCRRRNVGLTCARLRCTRYRTRIVASIDEHVQTVQIFHWIKYCQLCSRFVTRNQESLLWCLPTWTTCCMAVSFEGTEAMNSVLQQMLVDNEEYGTFRFCGKEFRQVADFGIHVRAKDNTERVQPITYDVKHGSTHTQSLAWSRKANTTSQNTFENACVRDLRECNLIVEYATSTSSRVIYFSPDFFLEWCGCCNDQRRQFLSRTGTTWRNHSELQITTSLYHSFGTW